MERFLNLKTGTVIFGIITVLLITSGEFIPFLCGCITAVLFAASAAAVISEILEKKFHKNGFVIFIVIMVVITALTAAFGIYDAATADSENFYDGIVGKFMVVYSLPCEIIIIAATIISHIVNKKK